MVGWPGPAYRSKRIATCDDADAGWTPVVVDGVHVRVPTSVHRPGAAAGAIFSTRSKTTRPSGSASTGPRTSRATAGCCGAALAGRLVRERPAWDPAASRREVGDVPAAPDDPVRPCDRRVRARPHVERGGGCAARGGAGRLDLLLAAGRRGEAQGGVVPGAHDGPAGCRSAVARPGARPGRSASHGVGGAGGAGGCCVFAATHTTVVAVPGVFVVLVLSNPRRGQERLVAAYGGRHALSANAQLGRGGGAVVWSPARACS